MFHKMKLSLISTLLLAGCSIQKCGTGVYGDISPEDQLHSYITTAVNVTKPEQKEELMGLTSGPLRSALANTTPESFKRAYIDKKYDFKTFEILNRKEGGSDKEVTIEFRLKYKSWNAGESSERVPVVETTNRATMFYDKGQWSIYRVESQGTNFDWEIGLPMDDVSTKGVTPEDAPKEIETNRDAAEEVAP
jgi:hypothetical protein